MVESVLLASFIKCSVSNSNDSHQLSIHMPLNYDGLASSLKKLQQLVEKGSMEWESESKD
jgi:hypothetical protein